METENDLLNLLLKSPNSESIQTIAEQLEIDHNFSFTKDRNDLQGVWELRWSSSNSPFLYEDGQEKNLSNIGNWKKK